jgi:DNA mismatch repair ATPase MutL
MNNLFHFEFLIIDKEIKLYALPIIFDKLLGREIYLNIFKKLLENFKYIVNYNNSEFSIKNDSLLLDLFISIIKSKSCRDAVKFNEELDMVFIESLINNLGECMNPFLCAHGRHNFFILVENK